MRKGSEFTIGIEEEYLVVDIGTMNLVTKMPPGLMEECRKELGNQVTKEFLQCQIEVGTKVCRSMQEVDDELRHLRKTVARISRNHGCLIMAASTHPFSFRDTYHTDDPRYRDLAEDLQRVGERLYISGMHVHVGIADNESRIDLMNQISYTLPHFLALSTSSPFWMGENTGLKSYRIAVYDEMPRTGIPPVFHSYTDYMKHVNVLTKVNVIDDPTKIWWDIRPSFQFPTLEMRITDLCTHVDDAIAIAAAYRCWLRMLTRLRWNNQRWREYSPFLIHENRWRAQRYGIDEGLIDFGHGQIVEFSQLMEEFIEFVVEDAQNFGCVDQVEHIRTILERGTSAHQQLAVYDQAVAEGRSNEAALVEIVRFLIKETMAGID